MSLDFSWKPGNPDYDKCAAEWKARREKADTHVYRDDSAEVLRNRALGLAYCAYDKLKTANELVKVAKQIEEGKV